MRVSAPKARRWYADETISASWRVAALDSSQVIRAVHDAWLINHNGHDHQQAKDTYDLNDAIADAGMRWQPHFDSTLKHKPNGDYRTPYSHAQIFEMMAFPGAASQGAWALLMEPT
jgi:hypothetical protein